MSSTKISMDKIDPDYAQYTRGEISRGELYKRWKKRHATGFLKTVWREIMLDLRSIRRDFNDLFGRSA